MADKGYVLTWDAIIALTFVLIILVGFLSIPYFRTLGVRETGFQQVHSISEDSMEVLSKSGILDNISEKWVDEDYSTPEQMEAGDIHGATKIAKDYLDSRIPEYAGYKIYVGDTLVYSTDNDSTVDRPKENLARDKTRAIRFVSGFSGEELPTGWLAAVALMQNQTLDITELTHEDVGEPQDVVVIFLNETENEKIAYLVIPLDATLFNAKMNITWNASATWEPSCLETAYP